MLELKNWFCDNVKNLENGMYRIAYGILRNEVDVQDAVQEAIYKAYKNLDSLKDKRKFKTWIYKIVTNTSYKIIEQRGNFASIDNENIQAEKVDVDSNLSLWNAIQKLNEPYRLTIILFYFENLSIKEIKNITGINIDAIKKQLSRGREKIKELMKV